MHYRTPNPWGTPAHEFIGIPTPGAPNDRHRSGPGQQSRQLAADHGLAVDPRSIRFNDAGLDYQVAFATAQDSTPWVLRIPRRDDVSEKFADESRILQLVRKRLSTAVPDWRIEDTGLIAYPALPGDPGLTLGDHGEPLWHFDREDPRYARSLGRLIAELHGIDTVEALTAGIDVQSPAEVRAQWRSSLERVAARFTISADLLDRWNQWMADDRLWPEFTVFAHGELYPAHLLLAPDCRILSVLDWTTAKVGDPALDFTVPLHGLDPGNFPAGGRCLRGSRRSGATEPHRALCRDHRGRSTQLRGLRLGNRRPRTYGRGRGGGMAESLSLPAPARAPHEWSVRSW